MSDFFLKYKKNVLFFLILSLFGGCLLWAGMVHAQEFNFGLKPVQDTIGLADTDIRLIIARIIRAVLGLLGIIALSVILWGGYTVMTAGGNEEKIGEGKKIIVNGTIGLMIILSSLAITQFVLNKLSEATNSKDNKEDPCDDLEYASMLEHFAECHKDYCDAFPAACPGLKDKFVVLSITPKTSDTKMNNVSVRTIFSVGVETTNPTEVFKVFKGVADVSDKFNYEFLMDKWNNRIGVEAKLKPDTTINLVCDGGASIPCLEAGSYKAVVTPTLKSRTGKDLETSTSFGGFPLEAGFDITTGPTLSPNYAVNFDGVDDFAEVSINAENTVLDKWSLRIRFFVDNNDYPINPFPTVLFQSRMYRSPGGVQMYPGGSTLLKLTKSGDKYNFNFLFQKVGTGYPVGGLGAWFDTTNQILKKNDWNDYVLTVDNGRVYCYINGVLANQADFSGAAYNNVTQLYKEVGDNFFHRIGVALAKDYYRNLKIDDFRMYKRALTAAEIAGGDYNNNDLWFGLDFNQGSGPNLIDLVNGFVYGNALQNAVGWELVPAVSTGRVRDTLNPNLSSLAINNSTEIDQKLSLNQVYSIKSDITDNSGVGYVHLKMEKFLDVNGTEKELIADYYNGPTVQRGSDAISSNPYPAEMVIATPKLAPVSGSEHYLLTMEAFDIDNNSSIVTTTFVIGDPGGNGDACTANWQCDCGLCDENLKQCVSQPKILEVDPLNGASGNWITVAGKCFGDTAGRVDFATSTDGPWVQAPLVNCGSSDTWTDKWVVVAVPNLPVGSTSTIRLSAFDSTPTNPRLDYINDNFGPKLGSFEINNIKRPGLCSVVGSPESGIYANLTKAPPKTGVLLSGMGFGSAENGTIYWNELQATVSNSWTDTSAKSAVPENMSPGKVAVKVKSGNEKSNGVPFTVSPEGEVPKVPVIVQIDPSSTTPKSLITISGSGFGSERGSVFAASSIDLVKNCARDNLNDNVNCFKLNLDLGDACGNTWKDTEIIAEIPSSLLPSKSFIAVKNTFNLFSDGEDNISIKLGDPMPSICNINPDSGSAPLLVGEKISVYGRNFSETLGLNTLFYWKRNASSTHYGTWFNSNLGSGNYLISDLNFATSSSSSLKTVLPLDSDSGESMITGPIKIRSNGILGNSAKYIVEDCRKASVQLKDQMDSKSFRCCETAGADQGLWKNDSVACEGEVREAGYVWRFTTGKIRMLPQVVESCNTSTENVSDWENAVESYPSPVPSNKWPRGQEACLNSTLAIRFTVPMDASTLNKNNIKIYTCSNFDSKNGCSGTKEPIEFTDNYFVNNNLVELHTAKAGNLLADTWYHVELSDQISSSKECNKNSLEVCLSDNLQKTKPCGDGTAYCFDFKTGSELCTLKGAQIVPLEHTVETLGEVLDPSYGNNPDYPYYYMLWGRGSQECSVLNVDGLGWKWDTANHALATAFVAKTTALEKQAGKREFIDSRAKVNAIEEGTAYVTAYHAPTTTLPQALSATSTLNINLTAPSIISWTPNCLEACVNSGLSFRFNKMMFRDDFKVTDNFIIQKCTDENCTETSSADVNFTYLEGSSDDYVARFSPSGPLATSTWYQVRVNNVRALGNISTGVAGKKMEFEFKGKFRTKADGSPCVISEVKVIPENFVARMIGEKKVYSVVPMSSPDQCSDSGQELNPWWYGWSWISEDYKVASTTRFKSSSSTISGCGSGSCLLTGSEIGRNTSAPYLCGNGVVEPGEDCDVGVEGEIIGQSCSTNCLRPGNTNKGSNIEQCGNGVVDWKNGEECDTNDQNCNLTSTSTPYCTWTGSYVGPNSPVCGSGQMAKGKDCDLAITSTSTNQSKVGCSSNCLHLGTPSINTVTVCGNGILEKGEECEKNKTISDRMIFLKNGNPAPVGFNQGDWTNYCTTNCKLKNICNLADIPLVGAGGLRCAKDSVGCTSGCTLKGSSVLYNNASVCGDGEVGLGEFMGCEKSVTELASLPQNPVQQVVAVGLGDVNSSTLQQNTKIKATALSFFNFSSSTWQSLDFNVQKNGIGEYGLQCGFYEYNEYTEPVFEDGVKKYNGCLYDTEKMETATLRGVAKNSCCYNRPARTNEYPVDGAGINSGTALVCRNSYMAVEFGGHEIDKSSLLGNLVIAVGHQEEDYSCGANGEVEVNNLVLSALNKISPPAEYDTIGSIQTFLKKLWFNIKKIFFNIIGKEVLASEFNADDIKVWCSGSITATPEIYNEGGVNSSSVTSTIALYLNKLLPKNSVIAVVLQGGSSGIKDTDGIGIRNKNIDAPELKDAWVFATGNDVCRLKEVTVEPDEWLFTTPNTTSTFRAVTESTSGQEIVSIPGQYSWSWNWQPQNNGVFDVPAVGYSSSTQITVIASKNVEGKKIVVANAHVDVDVFPELNQTGQTFTGITSLTSMFCENPWPKSEYFPFEDGVSFGSHVPNRSGFNSSSIFDGSSLPRVNGEYFNFRLSYCADSGLSGNKNDDLPYLKPFLFMKEGYSSGELKRCQNSGNTCSADTDCGSSTYYVPGFGEPINLNTGVGICSYGGNIYKDGLGHAMLCSNNQDCVDKVQTTFNSVTKSIEGGFYGRVIATNGYVVGVASDLENQYGSTGLYAFSESNFSEGNGKAISGFSEDFDTDGAGTIYALVTDGIIKSYQKDNLAASEKTLVNLNSPYSTRIKYSNGKLFVVGGLSLENKSLVTVVDPATKTVVWQHSFDFVGSFRDMFVRDSVVYLLNDRSQIYAVDTTEENKTIAVKIGLVPRSSMETLFPADNNSVSERMYFDGGNTVYVLRQNKVTRDFYIAKINDITGSWVSPLTVYSFKASEAGAFQVRNNNVFVAYTPVTGGVSKLMIADYTEGEELYSLPLSSGDDVNYLAGFDINNNYLYVGLIDNGEGSRKDDIVRIDISNLKLANCEKNLSQYLDKCVSTNPTIFEPTKSLESAILRRFLLLNNVNDDAIGLQIFENPSRYSALNWLRTKYSDVSEFKSAQVGGYDAATNGNDYYINALNELDDGALVNRIYHFSINKDAQDNTKEVYSKLLNSLEFNINISDFGQCLAPTAGVTKLSSGEMQENITDLSCSDDFDCRDSSGLILNGTQGICSNAKTKLKRDFGRIADYISIQNKIIDYRETNNKVPDLKSGTYLAGYTVSRWPSWGKLGTLLGGLPTDKINEWAGCNAKADQTTCWDNASSTYYCPNYSSVYEYEFSSSTNSYMLHGPLEYLDKSNALFAYFIPEISNFTSDPWCPPSQSYSFSKGSCGNGIINIGEACDPIGSSVVSKFGIITKDAGGVCSVKYPNQTNYLSCAANIDCGQNIKYEGRNYYSNKPKICTFYNNGYRDSSPLPLIDVGYLNNIRSDRGFFFGCDDVSDCLPPLDNYSRLAYAGIEGYIGTTTTAAYKINTQLLEFLNSNIDKIGCTPISDFDNSFLRLDMENTPTCTKLPAIVEEGFCSEMEHESAYKICNNQCQWDYSSCQPSYNCGNGLVEAGEDCDDGKILNGTYGHCPGNCQKVIDGQFCGNKTVDENNKGKKLEVCDKTEDKYQKGFCSGKPNRVCNKEDDSDCVNKCVVKDNFGVPVLRCSITNEACDQGLKGCDKSVYNYGSCVSLNDPNYDYYKDNTCSWDCQSRAGYCGDGTKQSLEQCDDGNKTNLDGCNEFCFKESTDCVKNVTNYEVKNNNTFVFLSDLAGSLPRIWSPESYYKAGGAKQIKECFENVTGQQICNGVSPTSTCLGIKVVGPCLKESTSDCSEPGVLDSFSIDCNTNLNDYYKGNSPSTYHVQCSGAYTLNIAVAPTTTAVVQTSNFCGNGIVETYTSTSTGKEVKEICDKGDKNGNPLSCLPPYAGSCTYCSGDCKEVLTRQSEWSCGNSKIDWLDWTSGKYEKCDYDSSGQTFVGTPASTTIAKCPDKGKYYCKNDCKSVENDCVTCGKSSGVGLAALPGITIKNVMNPDSGKIGWPLNNPMNISLAYGNPAIQFFIKNSVVSKDTGSGLQLGDSKIVTNLVCNASSEQESGYSIRFGEGDRFPYIVSAENDIEKKLNNNYVITPPVLNEDQFRVVVKWGEENSGLNFAGEVFNSGFIMSGGESPLLYPTFAGLNKICTSTNLAECVYKNHKGVYLHPISSLAGQNFQATTIDTSAGQFKASYAFTVTQFDNVDFPIKPYVNSDLTVEIYKYKAGSENSIYKPDPTEVFHINAAENKDGAVDSAKYWHVFNLSYDVNTNKFSIEKINKIVTDEKSISDTIPVNELYTSNGFSLVSKLVFSRSDSSLATEIMPDNVQGPISLKLNSLATIVQDYGNFCDVELPTSTKMTNEGGVWHLDYQWTDVKGNICDSAFLHTNTWGKINYSNCSLENIYKCAEEFAKLSVNQNKYFSYVKSGMSGGGFDNFKAYFSSMEENVLYRFIYKLRTDNLQGYFTGHSGSPEYIMYNKEITLDEILNDNNSSENLSGLGIYLGYGDSSSLLYVSPQKDSDLHITSGDKQTFDQQWYVFNVFKNNGNLYYKVVNKFLPSDDTDYTKYDN